MNKDSVVGEVDSTLKVEVENVDSVAAQLPQPQESSSTISDDSNRSDDRSAPQKYLSLAELAKKAKKLLNSGMFNGYSEHKPRVFKVVIDGKERVIVQRGLHYEMHEMPDLSPVKKAVREAFPVTSGEYPHFLCIEMSALMKIFAKNAELEKMMTDELRLADRSALVLGKMKSTNNSIPGNNFVDFNAMQRIVDYQPSVGSSDVHLICRRLLDEKYVGVEFDDLDDMRQELDVIPADDRATIIDKSMSLVRKERKRQRKWVISLVKDVFASFRSCLFYEYTVNKDGSLSVPGVSTKLVENLRLKEDIRYAFGKECDEPSSENYLTELLKVAEGSLADHVRKVYFDFSTVKLQYGLPNVAFNEFIWHQIQIRCEIARREFTRNLRGEARLSPFIQYFKWIVGGSRVNENVLGNTKKDK